jgi:chromosome segregation ATPase
MEEQEYKYDLSLKRRREDDERVQKIKAETDKLNETWQKREAELEKRANEIKTQEDEMKAVREKLASLEKQLPAEIEKTIKNTTEQVTLSLKNESELRKKDFELTQKLQAQNIANLERTIKTAETEIASLKSQLKQGLTQVTDLASQVIAARQPLIVSSEEKTKTLHLPEKE